MKKVFFFLSIILFSGLSLAKEEITIRFPQKELKQGRIEKVELGIKENSALLNKLQKLKSQKIGDAFYLQNIGPALKRDGENEFTAEGKVVIISEPKGEEATVEVDGQLISFKWDEVDVKLIEVPQTFINADFLIPTRINFWIWPILIIFLGILIRVIFFLKRKSAGKALEKRKKQEIHDLILNVSSFEEIVTVWKKKTVILSFYPILEDPFRELEEVLFKYQFKKVQTEKEKEASLNAYRDFTTKVRGVINGI